MYDLLGVFVCERRNTDSWLTSSLPTALLYKPIDRVTRSTLVLHVSTPLSVSTELNRFATYFYHNTCPVTKVGMFSRIC